MGHYPLRWPQAINPVACIREHRANTKDKKQKHKKPIWKGTGPVRPWAPYSVGSQSLREVWKDSTNMDIVPHIKRGGRINRPHIPGTGGHHFPQEKWPNPTWVPFILLCDKYCDFYQELLGRALPQRGTWCFLENANIFPLSKKEGGSISGL